MTDIRSLERTLIDNLPWNKDRIKCVARFLLALYATRTINLSILATSFSGHAIQFDGERRLGLAGDAQVARRYRNDSALCHI